MKSLNLPLAPAPTLKTDRLVLRELIKQDDEDLFVLRSNPEIMKYIDRPLAKRIEDIHELISEIEKLSNAGTAILWAITAKDDDKLMGTIGYYRIQEENYRGEIGYILHPDLHGKGIMSEAMATVIDFGFSTIGFNSIEARTSPINVKSMASLQRNGFSKDGQIRQNYYFNGKFIDTMIFTLLRSEHTGDPV